MISRTEINNKMNNNSEGHITLTEVLTDLLTDVESVKSNAEVAADANDEVIEAARNELTEGGFGDDETEETFEVDTNLLEGFFSGGVKKNYQMLANADILKTDDLAPGRKHRRKDHGDDSGLIHIDARNHGYLLV